MALVDKLSSLYNVTAIALIAMGTWHANAHALEPVKLLEHDFQAIHTFLTGSMGHSEINNQTLDKYTHTGGLVIANSTIKDLNNLGSVKINGHSRIDKFGILGSVRVEDSRLGHGWMTGSVMLTNTEADNLDISADTITLVHSEINKNITLSDPRNGHRAHITLDSTTVHGRIICKSECVINKSPDSVVEGGVKS